MERGKFVKGYCTREDEYFGLIVDRNRTTEPWKVVNFFPITKKEGQMLASEVRQSPLYSAENLLSCPTCGNRKVGGCRCATRYGCPGVDKSCINCLYCDQFKVDSDVFEDDGTGETVVLGQNQVVRIPKRNGQTLEHLIVKCGWDPTHAGPNMDVDSSVIVKGYSGYEVVYFGDLDHESGCVHHHGDDLFGGRGEEIDVYFKKVPSSRDTLVFVINIYECLSRGQTLGDVRNMYIKLIDAKTNKTIIEYHEAGNMHRATALIIGAANRKGNDWYFKAVGKASFASDIAGLADECDDLF